MAKIVPARKPLQSVELLLVDDDISLGALVAEYAAYEDYVVATAHSAEAGLVMIAERPFSLVILDVMLPGLDGFEMLARLRSYSDIPVLMLTTRGGSSDRVRGLNMGADDYLPKPFEPVELLARVSSILRRVQPPRNGVRGAVIGSVELDERSRRVTRSGQTVDLTGAEFSLLRLFLLKPGHILSRQELIPQVLSRHEYAVDRSIDTLVSNLRRKLGPLPDGRERIQSVRGVGYVYLTVTSEDAG